MWKLTWPLLQILCLTSTCNCLREYSINIKSDLKPLVTFSGADFDFKICLLLIVCNVLLYFVCIQGLLFGPLYHVWYIYLDRALPGRTVRVVLKKLAADQLFMTPLSIVLFFVSLGILEGQKFAQMQHDVRYRGPSLLAAEWTFGPATQLFNFFMLPTRFRVVYDSVVCLCFDVYYSYVKYRKELHSDKLAVSEVGNSSLRTWWNLSFTWLMFAQPGPDSQMHRYCLLLASWRASREDLSDATEDSPRLALPRSLMEECTLFLKCH